MSFNDLFYLLAGGEIFGELFIVNLRGVLFFVQDNGNFHHLTCLKLKLYIFPSSLQNVPPAVLVRFLREHRSEWADFNVDAYSAASIKAGSFAYPGMRPTRFTGSQIIMPFGHTIEHEEVHTVFALIRTPVMQGM